MRVARRAFLWIVDQLVSTLPRRPRLCAGSPVLTHAQRPHHATLHSPTKDQVLRGYGSCSGYDDFVCIPMRFGGQCGVSMQESDNICSTSVLFNRLL